MYNDYLIDRLIDLRIYARRHGIRSVSLNSGVYAYCITVSESIDFVEWTMKKSLARYNELVHQRKLSESSGTEY